MEAMVTRLHLRRQAARAQWDDSHSSQLHVQRSVDFSLFFFSNQAEAETPQILGGEAYYLEKETALWADRNGFKAIWTPERHFQSFGASYPNPVVLSAALAAITKRVQIRAGSVVLPLHHPIRVAEDWALVDQISAGRVGIALASGWHQGDFVLAPGRFEERRDIFLDYLHKLRRLWAGETVSFPIDGGKEHHIKTYPQPVQGSIPLWITTSGRRETWLLAGELGLNILTGIQEPEALRADIAAYRNARLENGFDPEKGIVTLMIHTFLAKETEEARAKAREPLKRYFRAFISQREVNQTLKVGSHSFSPNDLENLVDKAVDDFYRDNSLIGDIASCALLVKKFRSMGIDEIACLINFGLDAVHILEGLNYLGDVKTQFDNERQS